MRRIAFLAVLSLLMLACAGDPPATTLVAPTSTTTIAPMTTVAPAASTYSSTEPATETTSGPPTAGTFMLVDTFEQYQTASYPDAGGWYPYWSGKSAWVSADRAHEGEHSFRLAGYGGWVRTDAFDLDLSGVDTLTYRVAVNCSSEDLAGAEVGFLVRTASNESWMFNSMMFKNSHDIIVKGDDLDGDASPARFEYDSGQDWEYDTWYVVEARINYRDLTISFWLDGQKLTTEFGADLVAAPPERSAVFALATGYDLNGVTYFDDIEIAVQPQEPPPGAVSAAERMPGRWVTFEVGGPTWDVAVAPDGQVWAVGPNGALLGTPVGGWDKVRAGASSVEVGSDGVVWLSEEEGVVSFDGESWTSYPVSGWVQAIGRDGRVWVSGVGRVTVIDSGRVTVYGNDDGMPDFHVTSLVETPDRTVYASVAGCQGSGGACDLKPFAPSVLRLLGSRWEPVEGLVDGVDVLRLLSPVPWLAVAPDGRLWARAEPWGTDVRDMNLLSFDGEAWAAHAARPEGTEHMLLDEEAGVVDGSGIVWACTTRGELLRFDVSTGLSTATPVPGGFCLGLEVDTARGVVWIGTQDGLAMFDGGP